MQVAWGCLLAAAALGVGCGGTLSHAPPKPVDVGHGLLIADAASIPLELGEQVIADAEVVGIQIGTLDMRLAKPCDDPASEHWVLDSKLGAAGIARWFSKTQGYTNTILDKNTLQPIRSTTLVVDGGDWRRYQIEFKPGRFTYSYEKSSGEKKSGEEEAPNGEAIYDTQTAYVLLRSWRPKPKERSYFYVVLGHHLWRADVRYHGIKTITVGDQLTKVLHLAGKAHRINLKPGDEYTPKAFSMMLTADGRRVPIKVIGDGSLGSIHFDLRRRSIEKVCSAQEKRTEPSPASTPTEPSASTAPGASEAEPAASEEQPAHEKSAPVEEQSTDVGPSFDSASHGDGELPPPAEEP